MGCSDSQGSYAAELEPEFGAAGLRVHARAGLWRLKRPNICHLQAGDPVEPMVKFNPSLEGWEWRSLWFQSKCPKAREPGVQGQEKMEV